jgi:hypothetical protein
MLVVVKKYVVAVAQLVERRIVIPVVEGSIPFSHPTYFYTLRITTYFPYYYILSVLLHTFRIILYFSYFFISLLLLLIILHKVYILLFYLFDLFLHYSLK